MPSRRAHAADPALARRVSRLSRNLPVIAEAAVMLTAASLAIRWLPFRRVMAAAAWPGPQARDAVDEAATARQVRWAVERWANLVPWRAVCFQRGLAAHWMLRRRGIASFLHYGIDGRAPDGISAHVWVVLHGESLLGGEAAARHACVMVRPEPTIAG